VNSYRTLAAPRRNVADNVLSGGAIYAGTATATARAVLRSGTARTPTRAVSPRPPRRCCRRISETRWTGCHRVEGILMRQGGVLGTVSWTMFGRPARPLVSRVERGQMKAALPPLRRLRAGPCAGHPVGLVAQARVADLLRVDRRPRPALHAAVRRRRHRRHLRLDTAAPPHGGEPRPSGLGVPGYSPSASFAWSAHRLARWYWNGTELVWDDYLDVYAQQRGTTWAWNDALPGANDTDRPRMAWGSCVVTAMSEKTALIMPTRQSRGFPPQAPRSRSDRVMGRATL
jgi:hypothetical protein